MFRNISLATRLKVISLLATAIVSVSTYPASEASVSIHVSSQQSTGIDRQNPPAAAEGDVRIADNVVTTELAVDDGSFETAIGLTFGGTLGAVNRLTPPSYPATLTEVKIFFRQGVGIGTGHSIKILTSANPSGSDDVSFLVYDTMNATVDALGQFNTYDVPDITINSGDFVVGFGTTHSPGQFPIALDGSLLSHRSYVATAGLPYTHIENANLALIGNFGIRAKVNLLQTCSFTLLPTSQAFERSGGSGSFNVTTSMNDCSWTATTPAGWITITSGAGTGNGTVSFTVAANSGTDRSANISVGSQTFTVTQRGFPVPEILNVLVQGKRLLVLGRNYDDGAKIVLNGSTAKKVSNDPDNPTTLLIAKKAGSGILSGETVMVQVRNASGLLSVEFRFTRP